MWFVDLWEDRNGDVPHKYYDEYTIYRVLADSGRPCSTSVCLLFESHLVFPTILHVWIPV